MEIQQKTRTGVKTCTLNKKKTILKKRGLDRKRT